MLTPLETALIALLLVVLMFGMGATLTVARFREVLAHPRAFLIGTASQFGFMPLLAFLLAKALALPNEAALGLVVMGTCPGGTTSNLFAHLARADVALSISMTAASKLLGVVMMPLCLYLYARPFTSAEMPIPYGDIVKTLVVLLAPVALAMCLRTRLGERFARIAEKVGSICGLTLLAAIASITVLRNAHVFATISAPMYAAAIALGASGMLFGALVSRLFGLPTAARRTVSFETGVQNSPLCFALLALSFPDQSGELSILRLPLLYSLFVLLEASLATLLYRTLDARCGSHSAAESASASAEARGSSLS